MSTGRRLLLWDIDNTLIKTCGVGTEMFQNAFFLATGRPDEDHTGLVVGRTELAIFAGALRANGIEPTRDLIERYCAALSLEYETHKEELRTRGAILLGAHEALAALAENNCYIQTVLTGNLRAVSVVKLRIFGLDAYIDFEVGAYGEDHFERPSLVAFAQARAGTKYGMVFDRTNTVLIGDSVDDVEAADQGGAAMVAVATGRDSVENLRRAGAEYVIPDLGDVLEVIRAALQLVNEPARRFDPP